MKKLYGISENVWYNFRDDWKKKKYLKNFERNFSTKLIQVLCNIYQKSIRQYLKFALKFHEISSRIMKSTLHRFIRTYLNFLTFVLNFIKIFSRLPMFAYIFQKPFKISKACLVPSHPLNIKNQCLCWKLNVRRDEIFKTWHYSTLTHFNSTPVPQRNVRMHFVEFKEK